MFVLVVSGLNQELNCWLNVIFSFFFLILMVILNMMWIWHLPETLAAEEFWSLSKLDFHIQWFWFDILVDVQN